jgi:pimeloyl-ACP methyl ester carboxylesterase
MQIIVNQILTNYILEGHGSQVLLLHGWGDNSNGLKLLNDHLVKNHQIVVLDLPGFGKSSPPLQDWDVSDYAHFVKDFLNKIKFEPQIIIGHSNGGAIAIELIANNLIHPKKLILVASSGIRDNYRNNNFLLRYLAHLAKIFSYLLPPSTRLNLRKKVYNKIGSDMFVNEKLIGTFKKVVSQDVLNDAKKIKNVDVLLIYGRQDQATPISMAELFHGNIEKSKLVILDNCGHFIHLDQPQRLLKLIDEFI